MMEVSEKALGEFRKVLDDEQNKGLAVKIKAHVSQSSCCSCGPSQSYEMGLVESGDADDRKLDISGVTFFMDEASIEMMDGFEIDFLEGQGFVVKDKSAPSCGCGGGPDYGSHGHHGHGGHGGSCCG